MQDVLKNFNRDNEQKLSSVNFQSVWIENKGNFTFQLHALPAIAQWSPVYAIAVNDFNGDGNADIALTGNDFSMAPELGRSDALNGLVLQGDGKGNFTPLSVLQSGVFIPGNGKALLQVSMGSSIGLAASQNQGPLRLFLNKNKEQLIAVQPNETAAIVQLKNGKQRRQEFFYGSSFLSQSSRFVQMNASVKSISFYSNSKQTRVINNPQ